MLTTFRRALNRVIRARRRGSNGTVRAVSVLECRRFLSGASPVADVVASLAVSEGTATTVTVRLSDPDTPVENLAVDVTSSNQTILPETSLSWTGSGAERVLRIQALPSKMGGPTNLIVGVSDGENRTTTAIAVMVTPGVSYEYQSPGVAQVNWTALEGVTQYLVRIRTLTGTVVKQFWINRPSYSFNEAPGLYRFQVAPSGQATRECLIDVSDFTTVRYESMAPTGDMIDTRTVFQWRPIEGAKAYYLQVRNVAGQIVSQSWIYSTSALLTLPLGQYEWRVIPLNTRNVQARDQSWTRFSIYEPVPLSPPIFTAPPATATVIEGQSLQIPLEIRDADTPQGSLIVSATSQNQYLLPDSKLTLTGVGVDRKLTVASTIGRLGGPVDVLIRVFDGTNWAEHTIRVTVEPGVSYVYQAPGSAIVSWAPIAGVSQYLVRVRNSEGAVIREFWSTARTFAHVSAPGIYVVQVAASGQPTRECSVDVSDFPQSRYYPISPVGTTDRRELLFQWFSIPGAVSYGFQLRRIGEETLLDEQWVNSTSVSSTLDAGEYEWRVVAVNGRNEQALNQSWTRVTISQEPVARENILGIAPDIPVPAYLQRFNFPGDAIQAPDGTIYVADTSAHVIRQIRDGVSSILVGMNRQGYNGDGLGNEILLDSPTSVLLDNRGGLFVMDAGNYLLRRVDLETGVVSTVAGQPGVRRIPDDGGTALESPLAWVSRLEWNADGALLLGMNANPPGADNPAARALGWMTSDGIIHVRYDIPGPSAVLQGPDFIDSFSKGVYTRFYNNGTTRTVSFDSGYSGGAVLLADGRTLVGSHTGLYLLDAALNKTAINPGISFANITGVRATDSGYLIVDSDRGLVMQLDQSFKVIPSSILGSAYGNSGISTPGDMVRYDDRTILVLENKRGYIFAIDTVTQQVTCWAGNGRLVAATLGASRFATGFYYPTAIAVDAAKNVYVAEGNRVLKIDATGTITLFAGSLTSGYSGDNGPATSAQFRSIRDLQFAPNGDLIVADAYNSVIRKIDGNGIVTTIAGTGQAGFTGFGLPATEVKLNRPHAILPMPDGSIYVADTWNNLIAKIAIDGTWQHVAGQPTIGAYQGWGSLGGDGGDARDALLNSPFALAALPDGSILFSDTFNDRIRQISPTGIISTIWGQTRGYAADGSLFNLPSSLLVDGDDIFVADSSNGLLSRLRRRLIESWSA